MKPFLLLFSLFFITKMAAQQTIASAGANGSSITGSVSFTAGQIDYIQESNTSGDVRQGVQQPVEFNALLKARVYLSSVDPASGLMDDYIKSEPNFPLSDPYAVAGVYNGRYTHVKNTTLSTTTAQVLAASGNNAIVDWVFLELRTGTAASTTVVNTRAALLQKDGDVVGMDGVSPVRFYMPDGNYYLALRHRNHLGFRTAAPITLSSNPAVVDFTDNSVALNGSFPVAGVFNYPDLFTMVGGDGNADGSVDASDQAAFFADNGLFDDYSLNTDHNLDGSVDAFDTIVWEIQNGTYEELD